MALRHLFVMKLNGDPVIAFSGMIGRSENIAMAKELEIPLTPLCVVNLEEFKVVCMLDTQPGTGNNSLPPGTKVDVVIDHHPIREDSKACRWVDIRPDYGVTATILYEYLIAQDIYISTIMATSLFYAIKSETQDLGREANQPDRDAYLRLFPLTNKLLLYGITHPKLPVEHFLTIHNALEHTSIYHNVLVVNLATIIFPEVVSEIADYLLRLEGIETVLSMGHYNDKVILSIRTINHDINAGEIIKVLVTGKGTAGGHGMTAGGKLDNVTFTHAGMQEIEEFLTKKLLAELSLEYVEPLPLIKT
jgi:nanoRNase/pAp phosphatase (c-di-AMP/oligoRNAs hydrolase)